MSLSCEEIAAHVTAGPSLPSPPKPTQAHLIFREALCRHYKSQRDRSEQCLGDIITILQNKTAGHSDVIDDILMRLIKHYES